MDLTAITFCKDNNLPIHVFDLMAAATSTGPSTGACGYAGAVMERLVDRVLEETKEKMPKAIEHVRAEFATVRTGRANPALVEHLGVDYYGDGDAALQLAQFSVPDARMLVISPYEKNLIAAIEKAITAADLGSRPTNDGSVIRLELPAAHRGAAQGDGQDRPHKAEEGRVQCASCVATPARSSRHLEKEGVARADEVERVEKTLEKMTHEEVAAVDALLTHKEQELLEV